MLDAGLNIGLNIGLDAGLGTYTILLLEASCWHVSNQVEYMLWRIGGIQYQEGLIMIMSIYMNVR